MRNLVGPFLILIAALSWSTAGLFTRVVTTDIPTTLLWRSSIGGVCVLIIYHLINKKMSFKELFLFSFGEFFIAVLSAAGMICFISAFFFTTIANVSFVYGTMPLVLIFSFPYFLKRENFFVFNFLLCRIHIGYGYYDIWKYGLKRLFGDIPCAGYGVFYGGIDRCSKVFPESDTTKATYLSAFLGALIVLPFSTHSILPASDYIWLGLYGFVNVGLGSVSTCLVSREFQHSPLH